MSSSLVKILPTRAKEVRILQSAAERRLAILEEICERRYDTVSNLADEFLKEGKWVIFPTDKHFKDDPYHPETKLFPPHNIVGTPGQELYGKLKDWYEAHKSSDRVYKFNKNRYSSFQNTNLDNYLRERKINDLWLTGVCTDICVLHTAMTAAATWAFPTSR